VSKIKCRYCNWTKERFSTSEDYRRLMAHVREKHIGAGAFRAARRDALNKGCVWCGRDVRILEYDGVNPVEIECLWCGQSSLLHHGMPSTPRRKSKNRTQAQDVEYILERELVLAIRRHGEVSPELWAFACTLLG